MGETYPSTVREIVQRRTMLFARLRQYGLKRDEVGVDGTTVLHRAVLLRDSEFVGLLLSDGVDRWITDAMGRTALHVAAKCGDVAVVRFLRCGDQLRCKAEAGQEPAYVRAGEGVPVAYVNVGDLLGNTALHMAANGEVAHGLVGEDGDGVGVKVDVDRTNRACWTPLQAAAARGAADVCAALLAHKARIWAGCWGDWTPLHLACGAGHVEAVQVLLPKYRGRVRLTQGRHIRAVDVPGPGGDTALHCAVRAGQADLVSSLIACGADVGAAGQRGYTPLHLAVMCGASALRIMHILVGRGARSDVPAAVDADGRWVVGASGPTARQLAQRAGGEIAQVL